MATPFGRVTATRGLLLRLKDQLKFIKKGLDILKTKRDQLAGEINARLDKIRERRRLEEEFSKIYADVKKAYSELGYTVLESYAHSIEPLNPKLGVEMIMGVRIPSVKELGETNIASFADPLAIDVSKKMYNVLRKAIELAVIEATVERLAYELMATNRKVNALEKEIIPKMQLVIRYIEDRLYEEELGEFIRVKHVRDVIRVRRGG